MAESLASKKCVPCEGGEPPLTEKEIQGLLPQLPEGWNAVTREEIPRLEKTFKFKDFKQAIAFVNKVAECAEKEGHHPNILVFGWNKVKIEFYTHAIRGLHENDFIMAAKTEELYSR